MDCCGLTSTIPAQTEQEEPESTMPKLTVTLVKAVNLLDQGSDIADPYVTLTLKADNRGFRNDKEYGGYTSSTKSNERNPSWNETFVWEDVETLKNLQLSLKVMDKDTSSKDDKLGSISINLDKLEPPLEPIPTQTHRFKINKRLMKKNSSYIFLQIAYGDVAVDHEVVDGYLSHVGTAAYDKLRNFFSEHHHTLWNVSSGKVIGEVHQTPKTAFVEGLPKDVPHPDGSNDWFPEIMGEILSRTTCWADVCSLGPPDGRFMTAFQGALAKINENAQGRDKPVIVRMMFGNIVGMPVNCNAVSRELVAKLPVDANLRLWVGAWRRGVSWNHAKIIAVDGKYLHTGGHNMWDGHYLTYDPVHDLSLEMTGPVAMDGHYFANRQWDYIESRQESFWGTLGSKMPDSMPQAAKVRVTVSEWPRKVASEHAPYFSASKLEGVEPLESTDGDVPIISMGRYGCLTPPGDRPADAAFLAMMESAQTIIRLGLQDLGPVCIPGTKLALPGCVWPDEYLSTLAKVIWEKGVDVEIVLSNPGSIPGGLSPTEANYGNGWSCIDVAAEIIKRVQKLYPEADDGQLRQKITDNLRICFIREEIGNKWADGMNIGMHAKHFIVDDICTYIGSQNLYVCDLAEWGVVIDNPEATEKILNEYWHPMWKFSYTGEDVDVDAVMDGLEINRDGADPNDLDDETKEQMKKAELANAGVSSNSTGMYGTDEGAFDEDEC